MFVVTRADRGLAKVCLPGRREQSGVTRDDLSQPFYSSPWRLEERVVQHLRRTRAMRHSRHHTQKSNDRRRIPGAVSISDRPTSLEDRAVPGHWEGDLLCGNRNSQIATLVEGQTRYVMLVKIASKEAETVESRSSVSLLIAIVPNSHR